MNLPVGVIVNCLAVFIGGLLGATAGGRIPERLKVALPLAFSVGAMGLGINSLIKVNSSTTVILALLLGTCAGELMALDWYLN